MIDLCLLNFKMEQKLLSCTFDHTNVQDAKSNIGHCEAVQPTMQCSRLHKIIFRAQDFGEVQATQITELNICSFTTSKGSFLGTQTQDSHFNPNPNPNQSVLN